MYLGNVGVNGEVLDKALVCMFRAPASYTGEDTAEIHCHGGITVCRAVLDAAISWVRARHCPASSQNAPF